MTFLTPAVGAWVLLRGTTSADQRALGLTLAGWGLLPIVALFLADASVQRMQWLSPGVWLWLSLFAAMAGVGAWLAVNAGNRPQQNRTPTLLTLTRAGERIGKGLAPSMLQCET